MPEHYAFLSRCSFLNKLHQCTTTTTSPAPFFLISPYLFIYLFIIMLASGRMKKVTDPLDDRVKARIVGHHSGEPFYISSGSEHSAEADVDGDHSASPTFSDLLFCLSDGDSGDGMPESGSDDERDFSVSDSTAAHAVEDAAIRLLNHTGADLFRNVLAAHVSQAFDLHARLNSNKQTVQRRVVAYLRELGYNAAVCKTKWVSSGGISAGSYEFIDVLRSDSATRYVVDLDFAAEFEIARPTKHYERLAQSLPRSFVGKSEQLKLILKVMSDAARRSLKSRGLHIPPWRKHRFMINKWLGSYKRTTNLLTAVHSPPLLPPSTQTIGIKCHSIGFDDAVSGRLFYTAATRTR